MPTYSYVCDACSHEFDLTQRMSDDPVKKCPNCGKNKLRRLIGGGAGIIFKGSGFYITDYVRKSSGEEKSAKPDKKESAVKTPSGSTKDSATKKTVKGADDK